MIREGDMFEYDGHAFVNIGGNLSVPATGNLRGLDIDYYDIPKWKRQIVIIYLMESIAREYR